MELNWAPDYCLACDKQTEGETYCSQTCRLADLEKSSGWSGSTSPTTPTSTSSDSNRGSGFYLSPAFDFAAYKTPQTTPDWPTSGRSPKRQNSYFCGTTEAQTASSRTLSPSSSHSSLSSTMTTASSSSSRRNPLSEQVRTELRGYTDSFDDTRNWKRRMTWS
ncbi:hypothetical protein BDR22DRAFT_816302 [Usnea florida]